MIELRIQYKHVLCTLQMNAAGLVIVLKLLEEFEKELINVLGK